MNAERTDQPPGAPSVASPARFGPSRRLHLWMGLALIAALAVIAGALAKPWIGLTFSDDAPWQVTAVAPGSPAEQAGIQPGWTLVAVGDAAMRLEPEDRHEDPDVLFSIPAIDRFFVRQSQIADVISAGPARLLFRTTQGAEQAVTVTVGRTPLRELGLLFWVQWLAGIGSLALTGWVLGAQPGKLPAQLLFASAAGTALAIWPSAIYTTRELALDSGVFRVLSAANGLGIGLFAIAFAALLLIYPRQLAPRWVARAMLALPFAAIAVEAVGWSGDVRSTRIMLVAGGLLAALVLALVQWVASRRDPVERAATRWIFLSLLASLVFFAALAVLPALHNRSPTIPQGYMMAFSLVFFGGMAVAVARYRLFSIEHWSHRLFFYLIGALLLFLLDLALVSAMHMGSEVAFGIALLVVGFIYLPLRSRIWRWLTGSASAADTNDAFVAATSIALEPSASDRERRWRDVLDRYFHPLSIGPADTTAPQATIADEGLTLEVPASTAGPALALRRKAGGRALFQAADAELADSLIRFMASVDQGRSAYAQGATAERLRIARDLHDDVGARLLSAMHQSDERVRSLLQDTLADIRTLTGALAGEVVPLAQLLAETRHEASQRLAQRNITLNWPPLPDDTPDRPMDYRQRKALSSAIREIVTNIIKHSSADAVSVGVEASGTQLTVIVADNGALTLPQQGTTHQPRNGLRNIEHRIRDIGGTTHFNWAPTGLTVTLSIPFVAADPPRPGPEPIAP